MAAPTLEKRTAIREDWLRARWNWAAALSTLVLLGLIAFLAVDQLRPAAPAPADSPPAQFSASRAMDHLKIIAQRPHPTGSDENGAVRGYLLEQLTALGLDPQVQTATVVRYEAKWRGPAVAATVHNVLARLRGTHNSGAVMLAAHYDSVSSGPGASDDGSGTVTLLETARALKQSPPLANDVIFLFTDGEELGLLGAQAFVNDHPWAKDAALVLNFEARGACGPVSMFETSEKNGWLIREFAKAAPRAVASSLMDEAYKMLPNDTDMTVFKQAGMPGFNFAYIGCWPRYHTLGDNVQNISERSLQQDGTYALALARHFGNLDLSPEAGLSAPDAVYFSLFGSTLYYSEKWALAFLLLALLGFLAVIALGMKKGRLGMPGLVFGFLLWPLAAFAASLVPEIIWVGLRRTGFASLLPYGMAYKGDLYSVGLGTLALALFSALYIRAGRKAALENLTAGALAWWAVLELLSIVFAPGASFVFVWPLLAATLGLGGQLMLPRQRTSEVTRALIWALPAAAGLLLLAPNVFLLIELLSTTGLVVIILTEALLLGLLVPSIHILTRQKAWLLPAAALGVAAGFILSAMVASGYSARQARADNVFYVQNADTGKAIWASSDRMPDAWTSQFLSEPIGTGNLREVLPFDAPLITSAAPFTPLLPPEVEALDDVTLGDERFLRLSITSPRQARVVWISLPAGAVVEGTIDGKPVPVDPVLARQGTWGLVYVGLPEDGVTLVLHLKASQPVVLRAVDESDGLPALSDNSFTPRPADFMPAPGPFDSSTLVSKTFAFKSRR